MEWTETLCRETGIRFLTTRPSEIEAASFAIIKEELGEEIFKNLPQRPASGALPGDPHHGGFFL